MRPPTPTTTGGRGTRHAGVRVHNQGHPTSNTTGGTPTRAGARDHTHTQTPTAQHTPRTAHTLNKQHTLKPRTHTRNQQPQHTLHNDVHTTHVR